MGRLLFIAFAIVPLIEIACFVLVGQAIGLWPTLLAVVVMAFLGAAIVRFEGMAVLAQMRRTMQEGRLPARTLADAMLIGLAGILLLIPGFFTDFLGILLLIPPVRALIYRFFSSRVTVVTPPYPEPSQPRVIELDEDDWRPR